MTCSPSGCTGFGTSVGWDATTGWGTPHVPALIRAIVALGGGVRAAAWDFSYSPKTPLLAPFSVHRLSHRNKVCHADDFAVPLGDALGIAVADTLADAVAHSVVDKDCHADDFAVPIGDSLGIAVANSLADAVAHSVVDEDCHADDIGDSLGDSVALADPLVVVVGALGRVQRWAGLSRHCQ